MKQIKKMVLFFLLVFCFALAAKPQTSMAYTKVDVAFNAVTDIDLSSYSTGYYYFSTPYDGMTVKISLTTTGDASYTMKYYYGGSYTSSIFSGTQEFTTKYDDMEFSLEISPSTENEYCVYLDGEKIQGGNYTTGSLAKNMTVASAGSHKVRIYAYSGDFRGSFRIKDATTYAKSIKKKSNPSKMTVFDTQKLGVSMKGVGTVSWKSSNKKIVTVSSTGLVTAKAMGKATITATLKGGNSVKYTVVVNKMNVNIWSNESFSLQSYVKQISGYSKGTWKSGKKKAVTVNNKGKITAKDDGKTYEAAGVSFCDCFISQKDHCVFRCGKV